MARGDSLIFLFQSAGLGLTSRLVDLKTVHSGGLRERIQARGEDVESLLADWLNQIHFLFKVQGMVFCRFHVHRLTETFVNAEGEGELLDPGRHELKSGFEVKRFTRMKIEKTPNGWSANTTTD